MKKQKQHGQGVVEYAGALVVAAVFISAALTVGPPAMQQIFTEIRTATEAVFAQTITSIQ